MTPLDFDYKMFVQGYYSYSQRINNDEGEQLGVYRVELINSQLHISFFGTSKDWRSNAPLSIWKTVPLAVPLYEERMTNIIKGMTQKMTAHLSGEKIYFDWRRNI
jgi:hypothetical protein